jgi:dipeptidase E
LVGSTIVAIGGGEIGRPGYPVETRHIDTEIIKLTGKQNPKLLFIPTASHDAQGYIDCVEQYFGTDLGCTVEALKLYDTLTSQQIKQAIQGADIIYVGGGNTLHMMTKWRKLGIDKLLDEAAKRGAVLSGLSAGAICWFRGGLSDSRSFSGEGKNWDYITVRGLEFSDLLLCPHFDVEPKRQLALERSLKGTRKVAIALDNNVALEIADDQYRIIGTNNDRKAYKARWDDGSYYLEALESKGYQPLSDLH